MLKSFSIHFNSTPFFLAIFWAPKKFVFGPTSLPLDSLYLIHLFNVTNITSQQN